MSEKPANPFIRHREAVARAMCTEQAAQMGEPPGCDACDRGDCETLGLATAALDALWSAMQAEGSVRKGIGYPHSKTEWEADTSFDGRDRGAFPVLIIRTEPT